MDGSAGSYSSVGSSGCGGTLAAHLLHEPAHRCDLTRAALFRPSLKPLCSLFQVRQELLVFEPVPCLRNDGLYRFPHSEELAGGFKEQIFVQETVVEHRARLLPVAQHHHCQRTVFGSRPRDLHNVIELFHDVVLEEPIASLPQLGFAALFKKLQMKLCLFVSRLRVHVYVSPFLFVCLPGYRFGKFASAFTSRTCLVGSLWAANTIGNGAQSRSETFLTAIPPLIAPIDNRFA